VVVALDASGESGHALESSIALACGLGTELVGVFVEDVNVVRMAAFPAARVLAPGAMSWDVDVPTIERALRVAAAEWRRRLEVDARDRALAVTFRVARGMVEDELAAAGEEGDLVVVAGHATPGLWSSLAAAARGSVLILSGGSRAPRPIVVLSADRVREKALVGAARVATATARPLVVLRSPDSNEEDFQIEVARALAGLGPRPAEIATAKGVAAVVAAALRRPGAVFAAPDAIASPPSADDVEELRRAGCSILFAR